MYIGINAKKMWKRCAARTSPSTSSRIELTSVRCTMLISTRYNAFGHPCIGDVIYEEPPSSLSKSNTPLWTLCLIFQQKPWKMKRFVCTLLEETEEDSPEAFSRKVCSGTESPGKKEKKPSRWLLFWEDLIYIYFDLEQLGGKWTKIWFTDKELQ